MGATMLANEFDDDRYSDGTDPETLNLEQVTERFKTDMGMTVSKLKDMAVSWRWYVRHGHEKLIEGFREGVGHYVQLIANRRVAPEIVKTFLGQASKIRAVAGLPLERQRELANGATVSVYEPNKKAVIEVTLAKLPPENLGYVFRDGKELDPSEQEIIHRPKRHEPVREAKTIKVDRQTQSIKIGQTTVPIAKVMGAMAEAAGRQGNIDANQHATDCGETIIGNVTPDEKQRIQSAAKATGLPTTEWVRRACLSQLV